MCQSVKKQFHLHDSGQLDEGWKSYTGYHIAGLQPF
jgi:hypothetical protein